VRKWEGGGIEAKGTTENRVGVAIRTGGGDTLRGEVSQTGGGSGHGGDGSNVKSTAQSCRRGAILRAKGRRLPDVWKGSRAIIEGKKGLCGFIGAVPHRPGDDLIDCFSRSG